MKVLKSHPLLSIFNSYLVDFHTPYNLIKLEFYPSLFYLCLVILRIITGVTVAMHYMDISSELYDYILFYTFLILFGFGWFIVLTSLKIIYESLRNPFTQLRIFYSLLLVLVYTPYLILVLLITSGIVSIFVDFIPTLYCEGVDNLFPVEREFADLSVPNTKDIIIKAYSGVSGIYMFQCNETGGIYIGSSIDLYDRFYKHINDISSNLHLQSSANKYGWDSFIFRVIETCLPTELMTREQFYLDILFKNFSKELIYNFCAFAYSTLGYRHNAEALAAISAAISVKLIGNTNRLGITHTAEAKAAISQAKIGNTNAIHITVFVYDLENKLVAKFPSQREAARSLNVPQSTFRWYLKTGRVYKGKYTLRSTPLVSS